MQCTDPLCTPPPSPPPSSSGTTTPAAAHAEAIIAQANAAGCTVTGPHPADTLFAQAARPESPIDAVIALYHDQGLIPVKLLGRGQSVHLTMGLPIIRTSVDHGTAKDIAWQGIADPAGLVSAIEEAISICRQRSC